MKRYILPVDCTLCVYVTVEAENEDRLQEIAKNIEFTPTFYGFDSVQFNIETSEDAMVTDVAFIDGLDASDTTYAVEV